MWSWVIPDGIVGAIIGIFAKQYAVKDGGFTKKSSIAIFNGVQIAANAIAWIAVAPALDILIYAEPVNKVFTQGAFAFLGNIIIIGILGTLIIAGYSKIAEKSNNLSVEE
jgi:energy-coupling factor transport system substrate-specific component